MVRVQPWLHLEGAQGTLLESGGVILHLQSLPTAWSHHQSLGLSCGSHWVCHTVWAALPGSWLTCSHFTMEPGQASLLQRWWVVSWDTEKA